MAGCRLIGGESLACGVFVTSDIRRGMRWCFSEGTTSGSTVACWPSPDIHLQQPISYVLKEVQAVTWICRLLSEGGSFVEDGALIVLPGHP